MNAIEAKFLKQQKNLLKDITPVATSWGTAPTNLNNITDGDITTASGTGFKTTTASGAVGAIIYDLGSVKTVILQAKMGIWTSSGSIAAFIKSSDDSFNTEKDSFTIGTYTTTGELILHSPYIRLQARYIALKVQNNAAATGNAKIYHFEAKETT